MESLATHDLRPDESWDYRQWGFWQNVKEPPMYMLLPAVPWQTSSIPTWLEDRLWSLMYTQMNFLQRGCPASSSKYLPPRDVSPAQFSRCFSRRSGNFANADAAHMISALPCLKTSFLVASVVWWKEIADSFWPGVVAATSQVISFQSILVTSPFQLNMILPRDWYRRALSSWQKSSLHEGDTPKKRLGRKHMVLAQARTVVQFLNQPPAQRHQQRQKWVQNPLKPGRNYLF